MIDTYFCKTCNGREYNCPNYETKEGEKNCIIYEMFKNRSIEHIKELSELEKRINEGGWD